MALGYCMFPKSTYAQNVFTEQGSTIEEFDIIKNSQFFIDHLGRFRDYENIHLQKFEDLPNIQLNDPENAYWIKFTLKNEQGFPVNYWLHLGVFDSLTLIQQNIAKSTISYKGLIVEYSPLQQKRFRSLQDNKYGFDISIPPQTQITFFLRIKNKARFETTLRHIQLITKTAQISNSSRQIIGFAIFSTLFFGILLLLILFSLVQYLRSKGISYLYYAIYLALTICYFWWKLEKSNPFFHFIFTSFPQYYYHYEAPLIVLIYICYALFVSYFLNAKAELPRFYKLVKISIPLLLLYFGITILITAIWGPKIGWEFLYWIRIILIPSGFYSIYLVFKVKHRLGAYILSGTLIMLIGGAITTYLSKTLNNHFIGPWDLPLLPIQFGMLVETLFFAAGLQYKSYLAEQEKAMVLMELQEKQKEAEFAQRKKETLTQLYANLSHESRTPITVILGMIQRIKGHQKERDLIRRNGQQLLNLINQILDINKLMVNKMQVNWRQGDIMQYTRYCTESFEVLAQKRQQIFSFSCEPQQLNMDFDPDKYQKIISNLLTNAIKFTPIWGKISVKASKIETTEIAYFCLDVSDSGPGIPRSFQRAIFDPYTQLPDTQGGSGLGLALVKELTNLMNGEIELKSEIGKGTSFRVIFPIHNHSEILVENLPSKISEVPISKPDSFIKPMSLSNNLPSILLVEDNEDILQYMSQLLAPKYNLLTALDGHLGFELAKSVRPNLIISDIMMPKIDGYEFCRIIKHTPITQHIPVILLTAKTSQADRMKGLKSEADAYLCKPFEEEELLLRVHQLLQAQKRSESLSMPIPLNNDKTSSLSSETIAFMEELNHIINENLENDQFKVPQLCQQLGSNHVSLNNKLKKLTGQSTGKYIRNYRLQKAKELLRSTNLTIAEISYKVGIPESSNFITMFKKAFGGSPQKWRDGRFGD